MRPGRAANRKAWTNPIWVGIALSLATVLAYANSFSGPFVFDDIGSITNNESIRHLFSFDAVLHPPADETVGGRPLVNLSLALNYTLSGTAVWSYHLVNLLIHIAAGLLLFGIARRLLLHTALETVSLPIAGTITALWLLHPLQTSAVTYVIQRAESLMAVCYLLTLYATLRATEKGGTRVWTALAIGACWAGMACKEDMVSAPLAVLLIDRAFGSGTFMNAWRVRPGLYVGLFCSWLFLALLLAMDGRGTAAGFDSGIPVSAYALTQTQALLTYTKLIFWPHPLIFDYGNMLVESWADVIMPMALLAVLIGMCGYAMWKHPKFGIPGFIAFAVLAPSSSIIPIATQTIAEHRIYLSSAVIICLVVVGTYRCAGSRGLLACQGLAVVLGGLTLMRNGDYRDEISLWRDTAEKRPTNPRAFQNLGAAFANEHRFADAVTPLEQAVRLLPTFGRAHDDLGRVLFQLGRLPEAAEHFRSVLQTDPEFNQARIEYARVLLEMQDWPEAERQFKRAGERDVTGEAHAGLGAALTKQQRFAEAATAYAKAVELNPHSFDLQMITAQLLVVLEEYPEAAEHFQAAVDINPGAPEAHNDLGKTLAQLGWIEAAIAEFQEAIRLDPDYAEAISNFEHAIRAAKTRPR